MDSTGDNFRNFQKNKNKKNLTYNLIQLNKKKNNPIKPKHHLINSEDLSQSNYTNRTYLLNYSYKNPSFIEKNEKKEKTLISKNSNLINLNNLITDKKKIDINLNNIDLTVPKKINKSELFHNPNNNISQNQDQIISTSNRNFSSDSSNDQSGFILNKKNKKMLNLKLINKSKSSLMLKKQKYVVQDSLSQSNISNNISNKKIFGNRNSVQIIRPNNNIISSSNDGISTDTYINNTFVINNNGNLKNENEDDKIYRFISPVNDNMTVNYYKKIKPKKMKSLLTHRNDNLVNNDLNNNEMDIDSEMEKKINKIGKKKSKTTYIKKDDKSNFMTKLKNWTKKSQFKQSHFYKLFRINDENTFGQEEQTPKQIQDLKKGLMHNFSSFYTNKQKHHVSFSKFKNSSSEKSKSSKNSKISKKSKKSKSSLKTTNKNISRYSLPENINSNFEKPKHYTLKEKNNSTLMYPNNFLIKPKRKVIKKFVKQLSRIPEISTRTKEKRKTLLVKQTSKSSSKLQELLESNEKLVRNYSNKSIQKVNTKTMLDNFANRNSQIYFKEERDSDYESKSSYDSSSDSFTNTYKKAKSRYSHNSFNFFERKTNSIRVSMKERKFCVENKYLEEIGKKLIDYFQNENETLIDDIIFCGNNKKDHLVNKIMKEKSQLFGKIEKNYEDNLQNILFQKDHNLYNKNKEDLFNNEIFSPRYKERVEHYMNLKNYQFWNFFYYENIIIPSYKFILNAKYLEVNIYEQIYRANYLLNDLNHRINEITLFYNFVANKYKKKYTNTRSKKGTIKRVYKISKKSNKFYNRFLLIDVGLLDFCFNDIKIIRTFSLNIDSELKTQLTTQNHKKISKMRLTAKYSSKKGTTNKTFIRSNTNQGTSILFRNIKNTQDNHKNNNQQETWKKSFFNRKRDFLANNKLLLVQKKLKIQKEKYRKKIQKKIYSSPLQLENNYYYNLLNKKKFFNKESILFQTHKIKSEIIKGYNDYTEIIFFYIKDNNFQSFKELYCKFKINPETKDEEGNSLLNLAVQCDSNEIIDFLLSSGALPNSQNKKLNTPLHYALTHQNFKIADLLIKNGADENIKNKEGLTPWQCLNSKNSII